MEKISKHISYKEAIRSNAAIRYGIENHPNTVQLENMRRIANNVFEPLRNAFKVPIFVSSFFRHPKLNVRVGGSSTSDHPNGNAMDLDDVLGGVTNSQIFYYIKDQLQFKQLIWEFGDDNEPSWVHVSYVPGNNKGQVLKAEKYKDFWGKNKTRYVEFIDKR